MMCLRSDHCCLYLSSSHKYYNEVNVSKYDIVQSHIWGKLEENKMLHWQMFLLCKIGGFHSTADEGSSLLENDTAHNGTYIAML